MSLKTGREDLKKKSHQIIHSFVHSMIERIFKLYTVNQQTIEQVQKQNWMNIQKKTKHTNE